MIFRFIIFSVLLLLLTDCKGREEEIIDLSDIISESERYKENEVMGPILEVEKDTTELILDNFILNGIEANSIKLLSVNHFPDRFGAESAFKCQLNFDSDTVKFFSWRYEDSVKTVNAFFNWIDNFGNQSKSIYIGEHKNFQKEPLLFFVSDTSLIFIEAQNKVSKKKWSDYLENIGFEDDWNFQVSQYKWGKAKWEY